MHFGFHWRDIIYRIPPSTHTHTHSFSLSLMDIIMAYHVDHPSVNISKYNNNLLLQVIRLRLNLPKSRGFTSHYLSFKKSGSHGIQKCSCNTNNTNSLTWLKFLQKKKKRLIKKNSLSMNTSIYLWYIPELWDLYWWTIGFLYLFQAKSSILKNSTLLLKSMF